MIDRKRLTRALSFTAYFVVVFIIFLVIQFPYDRMRARIESEVRARTPVELHVGRIEPRFLNRFTLLDVVVSDRTGTVLFESPVVRAHVSLVGFLRGMLSLDLRGKAYGGELMVRTEQGPNRRTFSVDADGLDISVYPPLRQLGLKVGGKLGGTFELTNDAGRGRLWVKGFTSRELRVKGFPVPDLDFEQGWIEADLKGDRMTLRKLELDGKELKVRVSGDLVMAERGSLNLAVKFKPSERLSREQAGLLSFLKNRDAEGFYQLTLGGTMAEPLPRL